jgi:hypothetical protein
MLRHASPAFLAAAPPVRVAAADPHGKARHLPLPPRRRWLPVRERDPYQRGAQKGRCTDRRVAGQLRSRCGWMQGSMLKLTRQTCADASVRTGGDRARQRAERGAGGRGGTRHGARGQCAMRRKKEVAAAGWGAAAVRPHQQLSAEAEAFIACGHDVQCAREALSVIVNFIRSVVQPSDQLPRPCCQDGMCARRRQLSSARRERNSHAG